MSGSADEHAILLLKPDAFAAGVDARVRALAPAHGLEIRCRHRRVATTDLMTAAYPEVAGGHVLEQLVLECQYDGKTVEVVLVRGEDAMRRALRLRAEARERWGRGPFANVVHAADSAPEWALQLSLLAGGCERCRGAWSLVGEAYRPRLLPLLLPQACRDDTATLRSMVRRLWDDPSSPFWVPATAGPVEVGDGPAATHTVTLVDNNPRATMDTLAAALLEALPGVTVAGAFELVLAAARDEEYPVAVGDAPSAGAVARALRGHGLVVRIHEGVRRPGPVGAAGGAGSDGRLVSPRQPG